MAILKGEGAGGANMNTHTTNRLASVTIICSLFVEVFHLFSLFLEGGDGRSIGHSLISPLQSASLRKDVPAITDFQGFGGSDQQSKEASVLQMRFTPND